MTSSQPADGEDPAPDDPEATQRLDRVGRAGRGEPAIPSQQGTEDELIEPNRDGGDNARQPLLLSIRRHLPAPWAP